MEQHFDCLLPTPPMDEEPEQNGGEAASAMEMEPYDADISGDLGKRVRFLSPISLLNFKNPTPDTNCLSQLPACIAEVSKFALQACKQLQFLASSDLSYFSCFKPFAGIMNSPLELAALEFRQAACCNVWSPHGDSHHARLSKIQKIRDSVTSKRHSKI